MDAVPVRDERGRPGARRGDHWRAAQEAWVTDADVRFVVPSGAQDTSPRFCIQRRTRLVSWENFIRGVFPFADK